MSGGPGPSAKQRLLGACPFLLSGEHALTSVQIVEARQVEQDTSFRRMVKMNEANKYVFGHLNSLSLTPSIQPRQPPAFLRPLVIGSEVSHSPVHVIQVR